MTCKVTLPSGPPSHRNVLYQTALIVADVPTSSRIPAIPESERECSQSLEPLPPQKPVNVGILMYDIFQVTLEQAQHVEERIDGQCNIEHLGDAVPKKYKSTKKKVKRKIEDALCRSFNPMARPLRPYASAKQSVSLKLAIEI